MSIVPLSPEELRAALDDDAAGAAAEGWRLLRDDVRALAPPLDPEFERALYTRLTGGTVAPASPGTPPADGRLGRLAAAIRARGATAMLASGAAAALCAILVALLAAGVFKGSSNGQAANSERSALVAEGTSPKHTSKEAEAPTAGQAATATPTSLPAIVETREPGPQKAASRRIQEKAATITLAAKPGEVQSVADGVGRVASQEGGYLVNSQVNVQSHSKGEAALTLSLPSAHLTQALAALGRLASVRSQSNSLQDITDSYENTKRALGDAVAERKALLRALARATTQGEIESLRTRLSLAGGRIAHDSEALNSVTSRAANSRVEVSVLSAAGSDSGSGEGRSTLSDGLDEAGHVLAVALVVLLIALAGLAPIGLISGLALVGARRWRRTARERALDRG